MGGYFVDKGVAAAAIENAQKGENLLVAM